MDHVFASGTTSRHSRIYGGRDWVRLGAVELGLDCCAAISTARRSPTAPISGGCERVRPTAPPMDCRHRPGPSFFGTRSLRRTKATLIYRTGTLTAVRLLLGHKKIDSTVRYLGIEVDDALAIAQQV